MINVNYFQTGYRLEHHCDHHDWTLSSFWTKVLIQSDPNSSAVYSITQSRCTSTRRTYWSPICCVKKINFQWLFASSINNLRAKRESEQTFKGTEKIALIPKNWKKLKLLKKTTSFAKKKHSFGFLWKISKRCSQNASSHRCSIERYRLDSRDYRTASFAPLRRL